MDALLRDRSEEPEYREGVLLLEDGSGERELSIEVRPRGHSRRNPDVCRFPPLRLNFKKKEVAGTLFEGQDKLKLVTHCRDRSERNEQYLLQEYLLYRAFNTLTENSFRVRLAEIEYIDTDGRRKPVSAPGFLIEHKDGLARRLGLEAIDVERIALDELEPDATALLGVFQFMIGNTDWAVRAGPPGDVCCHNVEPFAMGEGMYLPVPYDFDSTGVIDPPYAAPHESLDIRNVRTRLYRGFCRHGEQVMLALDRFNGQKETIYDLFRTQPGLEEKTVERSLEYFDDFYEIINDERKLDGEIRRECRE
ncbi:MAG: hypothetical protein ACREVN_04640 [Gammaproteobacteria bacterium]